MSRELRTTLRVDGRILEGVVRLGTDALEFAGEVRLTFKFAEMFKVEANAGWLDARTARGLLLVELGSLADFWAEKIRSPNHLMDKFGVDSAKKVAVVGKLDPGLRSDLDATRAKVAKGLTGTDFDIVFLAASGAKDLAKMPKIIEKIKDKGAIWIVYPKSSPKSSIGPSEREVLTAGRTLQLTDNKRVAVDEVLTSVRFVVPNGQRKTRGSAA